MNKFISSYIQSKYGIDVNNCSEEDLLKITEVSVSDVTGVHMYGNRERYDWDFSKLPNLRIIDCSYNYIDSINVSNKHLLEKFNWQGVRGNLSEPINLSGNPQLKRIIAGQDGLIELDLSNNVELEDLNIFLNSSMRWIDLDKCINLKEIRLEGVNIPFVDLTHCGQLKICDINYMNLYLHKCDTFGDGYPRPLVFVNEDFDEEIIPQESRRQSYYTYYLIRTKANSPERSFLDNLKSRKEEFLSIPPDNYGRGVARKHYELLEELKSFRNQ